MGKKLASEIFRIIDDAVEIKDPKISAKKEVILAKRRLPTEEELKVERELMAKKELIDAQSEDRSLGVCYRGYIAQRTVFYSMDKREYGRLIVQLIKIGDVSFFAFPGEMYVNYGRAIKNGADTDKVFIATIANTNAMYFPTAELFDEKGLYETNYSSAQYESEMGNIMVNKLLEMQ